MSVRILQERPVADRVSHVLGFETEAVVLAGPRAEMVDFGSALARDTEV